MGFRDYRLDMGGDDGLKNSVFIYESDLLKVADENLIKNNMPSFFDSLNHLLQMIAKKNDVKPIIIDINNYRREREGLIAELARAAAKKVVATRQEVSLPAMNSYERRIVHVELAVHPDVRTESMGEGKSRYITIKPITK